MAASSSLAGTSVTLTKLLRAAVPAAAAVGLAVLYLRHRRRKALENEPTDEICGDCVTDDAPRDALARAPSNGPTPMDVGPPGALATAVQSRAANPPFILNTQMTADAELIPGTCVQLVGLLTRPDLNGAVGIVNGAGSGAPPRFPVAVWIDGEVQEAHVKLANMKPAACPPAWYTPPQCKCGLVHIKDKYDQCESC